MKVCEIRANSPFDGGPYIFGQLFYEYLIAKYGIEKQVDYISTGGGAFLEFLEGKTLPAIAILSERAST